MTLQHNMTEIPQQIRNILDANNIDLINRLEACSTTPLIDPKNFSFNITRMSFRPDQEIIVIRDDFICGGGKSRYGYDFIKSQVLKGYREFVYISPWYGAAQIALPWILDVLKTEFTTFTLQATIIIDSYPLTILGELPSYTKIGMKYGAKIIQVPNDQDKLNFAEEYIKQNNAILIKPGFDYPEVINNIATVANFIKNNFDTFDECWCAVGSGTLIRGLQQGNVAKNYFGVCIFKYCPDIGNAEGIIHHDEHNTPVNSELAPPFRSARFYDSKVWQYAKNRPGKILLWNVA